MASINTALLDANCVFSTTDFRDFFSSIIDDTAPTTALTTTSWINQQQPQQQQQQQSLLFPSYIGNSTSTADYMVPTTESSNDPVNYNANSSDPLFGAVMLPDRPLFEVPIFNNTMLHVDDHDPYHHQTLITMDDHHHIGRFVDMINNGDHNHQYMQQKHQEAYDHDQFIISTTTAAAADHRENFNQFVSDFQPLMYGRSDSNWYACRKTLADRRIRVRGRFARNNEVGGEEIIKEQNIGEEWLQDAVTSLMYLPIFAG
ncbi:hypothetical protein Scep_027215 [Stephania cephalantha]|uniref:CCT domain-containing protein n=1 Tax=Stephania cephalantha TaxID=152367 RepID=A0AAP0EF47_9MAGN